MYKVLIIEDHDDINVMLAEAMTNAGYSVQSVYTGIDGIHELKRCVYDAVLLDIMLPYKNGDEILRDLREFSDAPVMIISAKDGVDTKIDLLRLGADDYMTKPFNLDEVVARVESLLRRARKFAEGGSVFRYKDLMLDEGLKQVCIQGKEMDLTATEYAILERLLRHRGKVFTKANLYDSIWEADDPGDENAVKTHISNLRNKLKKGNAEQEYIETVWGIGYRLYKE